jgi:hypothetical protein
VRDSPQAGRALGDHCLLPHRRHRHAAESGAPSVKRCIVKAMLSAQFLDRYVGICLLQKPNNLFIGKPLLHVRSPFRKRTLLDPDWHSLLGAHHLMKK